MTVENFDQTLRAFQEVKPFKVFTVVLNSGKWFQVDHPGAMIYRHGVAVFISPGGAPILFDHECVEQFIAAPNDATAA